MNFYWTPTGLLLGLYETSPGPPIGPLMTFYYTFTDVLLDLYLTSTGPLLGLH